MLSLHENPLIKYYYLFGEFVKIALTYSILSNILAKRHFNIHYTIIEENIEESRLKGQFLTSRPSSKVFHFNVNKDEPNSLLISQNGASGPTRLPNRLPKIKNPQKSLSSKGFHLINVVWEGIEPPTQRFSVFCSTN